MIEQDVDEALGYSTCVFLKYLYYLFITTMDLLMFLLETINMVFVVHSLSLLEVDKMMPPLAQLVAHLSIINARNTKESP